MAVSGFDERMGCVLWRVMFENLPHGGYVSVGICDATRFNGVDFVQDSAIFTNNNNTSSSSSNLHSTTTDGGEGGGEGGYYNTTEGRRRSRGVVEVASALTEGGGKMERRASE